MREVRHPDGRVVLAGVPNEALRRPEESTREAASRMFARCDAERWDRRTLAAGLLGLAALCDGADPASLQLLSVVEEISPEFADEHLEARKLIGAGLLAGRSRELAAQGQSAEAMQLACASASSYLDLTLPELAIAQLRAVHQLAGSASDDFADALVPVLAQVALRVTTALGRDGETWLWEVCQSTLTAIVGRPVAESTLVSLWQLAKGLRLRAALSAPPRYSVADDPVAAGLLHEIGVAASADSADRDADIVTPELLLVDEMQLVAHEEARSPAAGSIAALRRSFDAHVTQRLLAAADSGAGGIVSLAELRAAIGPRTVLLDLCLGTDRDGAMFNYWLITTREEVRIGGHAHAGALGYGWTVGTAEHTLKTSSFAPIVASHRRLVQDDPHGLPVSPDGADVLRRAMHNALGSAREHLDDLRRAGKDHLCIVPHGPFHYYPFHLIGGPDEPLAARWVVTYLASHALLTRPRPLWPTARELSVIGAALPRAVGEARRIAAQYGVAPLLEEAATGTAVVEALTSSRHVHVATHGEHVKAAPALQSLLLGGGARLHAYEVLGLDLRNLRLLTLSACETALGRFDLADNLVGLPASFFRAGVGAIIGTLWPVEDATSERFFTELYAGLHRGDRLLDAFATAQRTTRQAHPELRDWGAFTLNGSWQ